MPRIDLPLFETTGTASPADADQGTSDPIDWRQLSHELRTPLNAILGNVELLLDGSAGPLSAQARSCIGEVQAAGRQLLREVRILLAWSELHASGPKRTSQPVDLIALIREASTIERFDLLRVEPHDACLLVCGDPFWLRLLVAEIIGLHGAPHVAPTIRVDRHTDGRALAFSWSGYRPDRTGGLHMALVGGIARAQGAVLAPNLDGLTLHWPAERLEPAEAARVAQPPQPTSRLGAGQSSQIERP